MLDARTVLEPFTEQLLRTDSSLYGLPHPKLAKVLNFAGILKAAIGSKGVRLLEELLKNLTKTKSQLVKDAYRMFPELKELRVLCSDPGVLDFTQLEPFLAPVRFWSNSGRLFEVEQSLDALLSLTDIGDSTPMEYFRLPFPATYFLFGSQGCGLRLSAVPTGEAPLLGVYVTELNGPTGSGEFASYADWAGADGQITCYDMTFMSRPVRYAADVTHTFIRLYVGPQMRENTVAEVLALNFERIKEREPLGTSPESALQLQAGIGHLSKVLLHLNSEGSIQTAVKEESELLQRLQGVKSKKFDKLHRRLDRTYDRIVLSHQKVPERDNSHDSARTVKTHWRRGHFRHQAFGVGRAQSKLRWIQPMLVGSLAASALAAKDYAVRLSSNKDLKAR